MKVAAYQAPLLPCGSQAAIDFIRGQLDCCRTEGVQILCCPECILGGLADNAATPSELALDVANGELAQHLAPLASDQVAVILGFTELGPAGRLYNSTALYHRGSVVGVYRKLYPAINKSVYSPGTEIPVFHIDGLTFGIVICNDSNFIEPARLIAAQGAAALFIPTNNALRPEKAPIVGMARHTDTARALENGLTVIRADVTGRCQGLVAYGTTAITDPEGTDLGTAQQFTEALIVAEIDPHPPKHWWVEGGGHNPAVAQAYARLVSPNP
ncbi:MAG: carbon-nitrogen hydrolase family protein [Candidatus Latescibacteria bacterium]|nr:carbon-nitrogen hydrolase family protein [Candidatus Latescibacterota bacterium]